MLQCCVVQIILRDFLFDASKAVVGGVFDQKTDQGDEIPDSFYVKKIEQGIAKLHYYGSRVFSSLGEHKKIQVLRRGAGFYGYHGSRIAEVADDARRLELEVGLVGI